MQPAMVVGAQIIIRKNDMDMSVLGHKVQQLEQCLCCCTADQTDPRCPRNHKGKGLSF